MTQDYLNSLLQTKDFGRIYEIAACHSTFDKAEKWLKDFHTPTHQVITDTQSLPDKYLKDANGNNNGQVIKAPRIAVNLQQRITYTASAFMCANGITLDATPLQKAETDLLEALVKVCNNNKLDFKTIEISNITASETACAELWYMQDIAPDDAYWLGTALDKTKIKYRMQVLSASRKDHLMPIFDLYGDMIAFGRGWVKNDPATDTDINCFDLYTDTQLYSAEEGATGMEMVSVKLHGFTKIPVIYYHQPKPEWADVQTLIDRFEYVLSRLAGTNDYFSDPTWLFTGDIDGLPDIKQSGRALQGNAGADAKIISWDALPNSKKLEMDWLYRLILDGSETADLSFENLKGLGTASGYAREFQLVQSQLKAIRKWGRFGESVQRRVNFLKVAVTQLAPALKAGMSLDITAKFEFFIPKDDTEKIANLSTALTQGMISKESAVKQCPLNEDGEAEWERVQAEDAAATVSPVGLNKLMNVA